MTTRLIASDDSAWLFYSVILVLAYPSCLEIKLVLLRGNSKQLTDAVWFAVYADGSICLDILQNRWSPTYDVSAILTSIQVFLLVLYQVVVIVSLDAMCIIFRYFATACKDLQYTLPTTFYPDVNSCK